MLIALAASGYLHFHIKASAPCTGGSKGDTNCDFIVDITDLSMMLSKFGTSDKSTDVNNDLATDIFDLSILLSNYGTSSVNTTPVATIVSPANNATVTGTTIWTASASDTDGIAKVEFYIDHQLQWTDTTAPYEFRRDISGWDTNKESNFDHDLEIRAYDKHNNVTSAKANVSVKNQLKAVLGSDRSVLSINPYAAQNVWYRPLPASTPLDPNSKNIVADIPAQIQRAYGNASLNTQSYSPAFYIAQPTDPKVSFGFYNCQNKNWIDSGLLAQLMNVPMPANANPASGSDGEMAIYDVANKTQYEIWNAKRVNNKWYGCWGGKMSDMNTNIGVHTRPYGTTATGLPFLGSTITIDELTKGKIPHALAYALVEMRPYGQSWPANRNDGWSSGRTAEVNIPWEGQRLRLDPAVNVDALPMNPIGKMIARAIQTYGMVGRDKAGSVTFYAENAEPYISATGVNPYTKILNGSPTYKVMDGFPWDKMQALPKDWGQNPSEWP